MPNWIKVATEADIPDGGSKQVEVSGEPVALFNVAGTLCAVHNTCLHRGGPLAEGDLNGEVVTCPWHGWQFDCSSGKSTRNAAVGVSCYPVVVDGTTLYVEA